YHMTYFFFFFFSSRRRHTRLQGDWSSDVCSSDLNLSSPLLYAATTGSTPFRFNLHCGDIGHTFMIGPPGSGKSTFLGFIVAQFFRYPRAQVFAFDKGYSLLVLTRACGGEFYDLGGETDGLSF